jgi:hypothetical protein
MHSQLEELKRGIFGEEIFGINSAEETSPTKVTATQQR